MHFTALQLTQFRNYTYLKADFSAGINALTGNNGAGKTNVLEAIHYLSMTRGFQRRGETYALQEGSPYFTIDSTLQEGENSVRIQCSYMPPKGKSILIDRQALRKMSDHIGRIPIIIVLPNDTQLIHGGPSARRKFMDAFISQYDRNYLQSLLRYEKALDQRNALLSLFAERRNWDEEQLELWDQQLIPAGQTIHQARVSFLEKFIPLFTKYFQLIVSKNETPQIVLDSLFVSNTTEEWQEVFRENRQADRYAQRTTKGTHKEDLTFTINEQGVKYYGSQGQQKTFVLALKLAQYELLQTHTQRPPLLLLDDVFDKLDIHRLKAIAQILHQEIKGQVFITDTSLSRTQDVFSEFSDREVRFFVVRDGRLEPA